MNARKTAEHIFLSGVESVAPDKIIHEQVYIHDSTLYLASASFSLATINRIYVIGAGKASALMAKEIESILGSRIRGGHVVTKYGHSCDLNYIERSEAGHPIPDSNGYTAAKRILAIAEEAKEHDLIICLLSGGGSSLLADFPDGTTLSDIIVTNDLLVKSGATIHEMNAVRKHLSKIKGGLLAKAAYPASLVSLILSDVIGDPVDVIASGPTAPDPSTFSDALEVLTKYQLLSDIPHNVFQYVQKGTQGVYVETPKQGNPAFTTTQNSIIGNNAIALAAARDKAIEVGLPAYILSSQLSGDTMEATKYIVQTSAQYQTDQTIQKPCCLLFGGETTLQVKGSGAGGRNQHMALYAAELLKNQSGITILSAGTDGTDGPTSAAGAVVDSSTIENALSDGIDPQKYLTHFNSFQFFEKAGGHIITGPTMTNVMDMIVVIVE